MDLQLTINVLMVAHYFTLKESPPNYKLKFNPLPSMKPSKNLQFRVFERRQKSAFKAHHKLLSVSCCRQSAKEPCISGQPKHLRNL